MKLTSVQRRIISEEENTPDSKETQVMRLPRCSKCGLILNLETNKCDNCAKWDKKDSVETQKTERSN